MLHTVYALNMIRVVILHIKTASVVWWLEFLATDPEVRVLFPALQIFGEIVGLEWGSIQTQEYN
jgi:hypothetical protein